VQGKSEEITQPKISEETMKEMAKFFMKTSIPRILAERKRLAQEQPTKKEGT
jgi:hypothetical protein